MNPSAHRNESNLEAVLRGAPTPTGPEGLADRLVQQIRLSPPTETRNGAARAALTPPPSERNWRQWWPILLPAAAAAAFATTAVTQRAELEDLRQQIARLEAPLATMPAVSAEAQATVPGATAGVTADPRAELARLRALVESLSAEVAAMDVSEAENARLRAAIEAATKALPTELRDMQEMKEKAARINCVNHMKQLGLAMRVWATDNNDEFPPNILSMTNELSAPMLLVCPADESRKPADSWATFTAANCSYEFLSAGPEKWENQPQRVAWRCTVHANVTLCDGSVQQLDPQRSNAQLVSKLGGLYLEMTSPPPAANGSTPQETSEPGSEPQ